MNLYRNTRSTGAAAFPGVNKPKRLHQSSRAANQVAQRAKAKSPAEREVSRKGSHGDIDDMKVSDPFLNLIDKPHMPAILEKVNKNHNQDTLPHILFLVEQWLATILAQNLSSSGFYLNTALSVMKKSPVSNSVRSWLTSTDFWITLQTMIKEVVTCFSRVMKVTEAVIGSQHLVAPVAELVNRKFGKHLEARSKKDEWYCQYVETLGSMRAWSAGSSDGPPTNISVNDGKTNWKAYFKNGSEVLPQLSHNDQFV